MSDWGTVALTPSIAVVVAWREKFQERKHRHNSGSTGRTDTNVTEWSADDCALCCNDRWNSPNMFPFATTSVWPMQGLSLLVDCTGDSYDYALAETINGLYKAELIHRRAPWKTRKAVELATLEWVCRYNHHRLLGSIGYIPPAEAEAVAA